MITTCAPRRRSRHLITFFGLALLLPVLLFVSPGALTQDRPVPPPPRRDLPPGPLAPVRTISITSSYLLCNSLQLQSARRVVWEPVLSSLGVSLSDRDVYGLALDNAATEVCAGRLDSELMNSAFVDLDRVMSGVEDHLFGRSLLTSDERIKLSSALLDAAYNEFQSRCFASRNKEAELMIGRLPKTPDVGLGLAVQPASAALGRCGSGGMASGTGIDVSFAQSQFQSCATKVLSSISQDCTGPAGQDRSRSTPRPTIEGDTRWRADPVVPGQMGRSFRANAPDGSYKNISQTRNSEGTLTVTSEFDPHGRLTSQSFEFQDREGRTIARFVHNFPDPTAAEGPRNPRARQRHNAEVSRAEPRTGAAWDAYNQAVENALRVPASLIPATGPDPFIRMPPGPAGPSNQCQAMTNSSTGRMGLLRPQSAEGVEGSGGREFISGPDLILRCLCTLGSRGAQLANQIARATGSPGVSCSNNEWLRRVDCVLNPRGPADGIRTECLGFLLADYQFDTPQTACDAAIQCPEGSQPIVVGRPGSSACRCSKDSSSVGSRPGFNCATVRCPPPGTRSSNPTIQACCGSPSEGSGKPEDGPPRPPGPKPGGPSKNSGDKKDQSDVGAPESLPKLLLVDDLIGRAAVSGGKLQFVSFDSGKGPQEKVLEWSNVTSGDQLTLSFDFGVQASVNLYLSVLRGPQSGPLRLLVNGKDLGRLIDLNSQQQIPEKLPLGQVELRAGANTITFITMSGKGLSQMRVSLLSLSLEK